VGYRLTDSAAPPAVGIDGLSKTFPGQRALVDVSMDVARGEVHGLLGENGSGKSTLIKVLSGFHTPDTGAAVNVNGRPLTFGSAASAAALGMRFVHQNLGIIPEMSATENLMLSTGGARNWGRPIRRRDEAIRTRRLFDRFGVDVPLDVPLGKCRAVDRTVVAIVRALDTITEDGVLVLDEPTAALPADEVEHLFDVVRDLRSRGVSTIYVSHRLDEVFAIVDRVSVLRDGVMQGTRRVGELDQRELVRMIVGGTPTRRAHGDGSPVAESAAGSPTGAPRLEVRGLRSSTILDASLAIHPGEIVGVAGLTGSGREEFASALIGAIPSTVEQLLIDGTPSAQAMTPRRSLGHGVALVPGNRGAGSAVRQFDLRENVTLPSLDSISQRGRIVRSRELAVTQRWIDQLDIRPTDPLRGFRQLSGGNQQKVILAKWFNLDPRVVLLDNPTAGVDVGARQAIYDLIRERAGGGTSFLVASSDHEDLLSICSRVLVFRNGRIATELIGGQLQLSDLLLAQSEPQTEESAS
jgi:ribose transport system ATP-binding protein